MRECFPRHVLLGSVDRPVEITESCSPVSVEQDGDIVACICTEDFCNDPEHDLLPPAGDTESTRQQDNEETVADVKTVVQEIDISVTAPPESSTNIFKRVICHQCGSLFSNKNSDCQTFDETDKSQQGFCEPGQACLYYSWQKTKAHR